MYLVDTNVWLERLLDQVKSEEVGKFIGHMPSERLSITDFTFHSIGVILDKLNRREALRRFVQDVFTNGAVVLVHLGPEDMERLLHVISQFKLDFDDAYQYVAAEKHNLTIVSFDGDFDRTERGKKTPGEILAT